MADSVLSPRIEVLQSNTRQTLLRAATDEDAPSIRGVTVKVHGTEVAERSLDSVAPTATDRWIGCFSSRSDARPVEDLVRAIQAL
jgi:hypothetical protein